MDGHKRPSALFVFLLRYLNGTNLKICGYLVLSDLLQCCHGNANIIQVFDLAVEFLSCFINKAKNLLHL